MTGPKDPLEVVAELMAEEQVEKTYPGSKRVRKAFTREQPAQRPSRYEDDWDAKPNREIVIDGVLVELFTIGSVAQAMERSATTIREWERYGIIPKAPFEIGSGRGKRRLYSRAHIEGMVRIAMEEGILVDPGKRVPDFTETGFTEKLLDLWERLRIR